MYSSSRDIPTDRIDISLNAELVDWVDRLVAEMTDDLAEGRVRAIEEAIYRWCQQQTKQRLQRSADYHHQRHNDDETGWLV